MPITYEFLFLLLLINAPGFAQVGVGTTTPQYPLDVHGRIRIQYHNRSQEGAGLWFNKPDNTLGTFIGQTATGHFGIAANASGNWNFVFDHQHTRLGIGTDAPSSPLTIRLGGLGLEHVSTNGAVSLGTYVSNTSAYIQTNTNTPLRFATNNADGQLTLGTNGYFGIGTLTPNYPLSFASVVGDKISLWSTDPNSPTAPHYGLGIQGYQFQMFAPTATDNIVFGIGSSANFTERVRFTGDGNVGIGTTTPTLGGLVVDKKVGAVNAIFGTNSTGVAIESNYPGVAFNSYYNNGRKAIAPGFGGLIGQDPGNGRVYIYSSPASIGAANADMPIAERLSILPNGNVGIGNTNPQAKLDVAGNVKIVDGTQGAGKVLTSDADGDATWQKLGYGAVALVITDGYLALTNDVTAILSGAEQLDDDNRWYSSMYITGATATGYYLLQGSVRADLFGVGDSGYRIQVLVNGSLTRTSAEGRSEGTGANYVQIPTILNTVVKCNAGDIISFRVYAKGSDAVVLRGDPQFTITKL